MRTYTTETEAETKRREVADALNLAIVRAQIILADLQHNHGGAINQEQGAINSIRDMLRDAEYASRGLIRPIV